MHLEGFIIMVKINCVETAKKNFINLNKEDIEEMFKKINNAAKVAQFKGDNVAAAVQKSTNDLIARNEVNNKLL